VQFYTPPEHKNFTIAANHDAMRNPGVLMAYKLKCWHF